MLIVVLAMRQEADFLLTGCEQAPRFGHWEVTYTSDANMTLSCWTMSHAYVSSTQAELRAAHRLSNPWATLRQSYASYRLNY